MVFTWLIVAILCLRFKNVYVQSLCSPQQSTSRSGLTQKYLKKLEPEIIDESFNFKENLILELNNFYTAIDSFISSYNDTLENQKKLRIVDIIKDFIEANTDLPEIEIPSHCPLNRGEQGIFTINITGQEPFEVLCTADIAGPGWTTVAQRKSGTLNFLQDWATYKKGFGNFTDEFFIGLEKLHAITISQNQELYIYLEDFEGNFRYARYEYLLIGSEDEKYALTKLGLYTGNAGDSLSQHVGNNFSTFDSDNEQVEGNAAIHHLGAWWYGENLESNLFGQYFNGENDNELKSKTMFWDKWLGDSYSYKVMRMMVRPRCPCLYES